MLSPQKNKKKTKKQSQKRYRFSLNLNVVIASFISLLCEVPWNLNFGKYSSDGEVVEIDILH